nr:hypothetical protein [Phenylobacterium sp.]
MKVFDVVLAVIRAFGAITLIREAMVAGAGRAGSTIAARPAQRMSAFGTEPNCSSWRNTDHGNATAAGRSWRFEAAACSI